MRYALLICVLLSSVCNGQRRAVPLSGWKAHPVPTDDSTLMAYNASDDDWTVWAGEHRIYAKKDEEERDGRLPFTLVATKQEEFLFAGRRIVAKVHDGYLVGFNRGEWGGNLYWFSADGKERDELSRDQVVQFVRRGGQLYAIEGLAHMSNSEGSIIQLQKKDGKWISSNYATLPSAPVAIVLDDSNQLLVVTSGSLLTVDTAAQVRMLVQSRFWKVSLNPNSLVMDHGTAYIGMRGGVLKYDLKKQEQSWLMPK